MECLRILLMFTDQQQWYLKLVLGRFIHVASYFDHMNINAVPLLGEMASNIDSPTASRPYGRKRHRRTGVDEKTQGSENLTEHFRRSKVNM